MAAALSVRLAVLVCRQSQRAVTVSSHKKPLYATQATSKFYSLEQSHVSGTDKLRSLVNIRAFHTSYARKGLEEFFDLPENWGEENVKSGAPWTAEQLRAKSNEDLHKLWYVLLKEQNMLLTMDKESRRQGVAMPSPERLKKVERSMKRLDLVVKEREDALRLLQTGQEYGRPGEYRKNVFGKTIWYVFKEHPIPWYLNSRYKKRQFYEPYYVAPFVRLRIEQDMKNRARRQNRERQNKEKLALMFPKKT
ncbi:hypothetical protein DNTS_003459 [Danionella cerebrum]|uniref:Large ribosomal subunit protein uL29m n=1 Tax=Danionella cerebrum TaxID=2873325 RepID=A0A553QH76_9TELE|nr:hypothetical protein DNTS_003459 [Danionella translucida]